MAQVEQSHVMTVARVSPPERAWEYGFQGTTKGTALAPLVLAPPEDDWHETVLTKRKLREAPHRRRQH